MSRNRIKLIELTYTEGIDQSERIKNCLKKTERCENRNRKVFENLKCLQQHEC